MNKLESVNSLLRFIRVRPVATLDIGHPDVIDAIAELEQQARVLMRTGWWFNTVVGVQYSPDPVTKHIQLPTNVLSIKLTDPRDLRRYPLLAMRDQLVFNAQENTYKFEEPLILTICQELEWDMLPESAQQLAMLTAGERFVSDKTADEIKRRELAEKKGNAFADMISEDITTKQYNVFQTPRVAYSRRGHRPFNLARR